MGKSATLLSSRPQGNVATNNHPRDPSPTPTRHNLTGAATPAGSSPASSLSEKTLTANPSSPGITKSLSGLEIFGNSPPSSDVNKSVSRYGDSAVGDTGVDACSGMPDGALATRSRYGTIHSRVGSAKGSTTANVEPPPLSNLPSTIEDLDQPARAADLRPNFDSRQAQTSRLPTSKAVLFAADSAPSPYENPRLDYTAHDSQRVGACLKKIGFEHIGVVKTAEAGFLTYDAFMKGLDFLLSGAMDGDMLVMLVSTHAFRDFTGVHLKVKNPGEPIRQIGTHELVDIINVKLCGVRCTVEVVLDVCYAAGLIRCKHIIRKLESEGSTIVISATMEENVSAPAPAHPFLPAGHLRHQVVEAGAPTTSHTSLYAPPLATNASMHIKQTVVAAPPSLPPPSTETTESGLAGNCNFFMRKICSLFGSTPPELQTESDIVVWAATGEDQKAFEYLPWENERSNGGLVYAICTAIEENECISRKEVFDRYVLPVMEEMNEPSDPQHPQLLSNRGHKKRILRGNIFQALPKAEE